MLTDDEVLWREENGESSEEVEDIGDEKGLAGDMLWYQQG